MILRRGWVWASLGLLLVAALGMFYWLRTAKYTSFGSRVPLHTEAYDFRLTAQGGQTYRLSDFKDTVVLIVFGYVNCSDVTPRALSDLSKFYRTLTTQEQAKVQVLLISTDPQRDTPEQLGRYVKSFDPSFIGLTGTPTELATTAQQFGVRYGVSKTKSAKEYWLSHTAGVFVVDPRGHLEQVYASSAG